MGSEAYSPGAACILPKKGLSAGWTAVAGIRPIDARIFESGGDGTASPREPRPCFSQSSVSPRSKVIMVLILREQPSSAPRASLS